MRDLNPALGEIPFLGYETADGKPADLLRFPCATNTPCAVAFYSMDVPIKAIAMMPRRAQNHDSNIDL